MSVCRIFYVKNFVLLENKTELIGIHVSITFVEEGKLKLKKTFL